MSDLVAVIQLADVTPLGSESIEGRTHRSIPDRVNVDGEPGSICGADEAI